MDTAPHQSGFTLDVQRTGSGAGCRHHRAGVKCFAVQMNLLDRFGQLHPAHRADVGDRAEPLCALLHLFAQRNPVNAGIKTGVIVDAVGQRHLPARRELFQHQRAQPRAGGVQRRRITAGSAADDRHIIYGIHKAPLSFLSVFSMALSSSKNRAAGEAI